MGFKNFSRQRAFIIIGIALITISQIIFGLIFYPVISQEVSYKLQTWGKKPSLDEEPKVSAQNGEFKLLIPKISIDSQIFPDVDPFNKKEYLEILKKGVAQAKGSAPPGEEGNVFIFAHSTDSIFNIANYNAVFYLVNKLIAGDAIYLTYGGRYYKYIVEKTSIVDSNEINYLKTQEKGQILTLMTCWPPGTTLKRLLVIARGATD